MFFPAARSMLVSYMRFTTKPQARRRAAFAPSHTDTVATRAQSRLEEERDAPHRDDARQCEL